MKEEVVKDRQREGNKKRLVTERRKKGRDNRER